MAKRTATSTAKTRATKKAKAPPAPSAGLAPAAAPAMTGLLSCVANFMSPAMKKSLPAEFGDHLRTLGLSTHGRVAAGFFPGGFLHAAPGQPFNAAVEPDMAWARGATIRVAFLGGPQQFQDHVRTFVKLWSDAADVKFAFENNPGAAQVRITFAETGSFYSVLGKEAETVPAGQHTMSLGFRGNDRESEVRRLVLHEFGHALGFHHEHQNPVGGIDWDIPAAIAHYKPLLPSNMTDQQIFAQLKGLPNSSRYKFTPFDADSIMLYQIPENIVRRGSWRPELMNNNTTLSGTDKSIAAELYGPAPGGGGNGGGGGGVKPRKLAVDGSALSDSISTAGEVDKYTFTAKTDGVYRVETDGDAIVHVTLADDKEKPLPDDDGADSISPSRGVRMPRLLDAGTYTLLVNASRFLPHTRGEYTIRVVAE